MPKYYVWDEIISKDECGLIIDDCKHGFAIPAEIAQDDGMVNSDEFRKTNVRWVDTKKVINKLVYGFIHEANDDYFHYEINNHEQMQFGEYEVGGHYKYHQDTIWIDGNEIASNRKLSASVLLSGPEDFKGGEFEIYNGDKEPLKPLNGQGSVIVFDSRDFHRICPVTSGVRYSLVMWAVGANFK